jgi:frataxin-like iron-binding protein CyaY
MVKTATPPAVHPALQRFLHLNQRRYPLPMHDERDFRLTAAAVLDTLKRHLIERAEHDHSAFEVREQDGALAVLFVDSGDKFLISPQAPTRRMSVAAPSSEFQLDWDSRTEKFVFPRTGENLIPLVDRLLSEHH